MPQVCCCSLFDLFYHIISFYTMYNQYETLFYFQLTSDFFVRCLHSFFPYSVNIFPFAKFWFIFLNDFTYHTVYISISSASKDQVIEFSRDTNKAKVKLIFLSCIYVGRFCSFYFLFIQNTTSTYCYQNCILSLTFCCKITPKGYTSFPLGWLRFCWDCIEVWFFFQIFCFIFQPFRSVGY